MNQASKKILAPVLASVFLLLVFSFTVSAAAVGPQTGLAVAFPAKELSVVEKTAQLDKASIVLINSIVTGTAIMPSFQLVQTGSGGGGASIVGTWQSGDETITFTANGQFSGNSPQSGPFSGTYSVQGNVLTANYLTPTQATFQFTFSIAENTLQLSHP